MDTGQARALYQKYSSAMAYVAVESEDGTPGIGSAFHVGEGVFVTATQPIIEVVAKLNIRSARIDLFDLKCGDINFSF